MKKKLAIILSAFNGEKYIAEQIESIMSQSFSDFDLFIHDDGSTDSTPQIINEYANTYENIKIIVNKKGLKYPACFIEMLKKISGYRYYAFSDQDDLWDKDKLFDAIQCLDTKDNAQPTLYYSAVNYTDSNLNFIRGSRFAEGKKDICKLTFQQLLFGGEAMGMTFVFNEIAKNALVKANETKAYKDWFLKLYCAACGEVYYNTKPCAKYRRHEAAVTSASNPSGRLQRYLGQIKEIYFEKETFDNQRSILDYINKNCHELILDENKYLFDLFLEKDILKNRLKKVTWQGRFRSKKVDEIGYRFAFLLGRI